MERFWEQSIFKYLRAEPEDHYVLLVSRHATTLSIPSLHSPVCMAQAEVMIGS